MLESILCVDDDAISLMLYKMVITKASFTNEIVTATNGEEALNYIKKLTASSSEPKKKTASTDFFRPKYACNGRLGIP